MTKLALYVSLEAQPGREEQVEDFLRTAFPASSRATSAATWYVVRFDRNSFAVFAAFPDEATRDSYLEGPAIVALVQRAPELFVDPPELQRLDILAGQAS
ncbi:putative quinol monooxygenase [Microvirga pudoricolor]|uniref:putative quinol monooxygenase n=1 Tax=Microvirga pudoricolor TaxID=2778729 RepID=UPI001951221E|nr:antibiotic biosynthesis monooxygenase [Microvirga pudoricolor]MBM6594722.1 antibiotic biosynthesis monooxygenase [Microvirga pudoricolor]